MTSIHSMTGFAAVSVRLQGRTLSLDLRSVNSRFLDIHFRVPDELRPFEALLRERITAALQRGKVDCRMAMADAGGENNVEVDAAALAQLARLAGQVTAAMPQAVPLSVAEVLRWPGMLGDQSMDGERLRQAVGELVDAALAELTATRAREGAKLADVLRERVARMRAIVAEVRPRLPALQAAQQQKLTDRLRDAVGGAGVADAAERINQEVALYAAKIDVAEELARLETHLDEVERVLRKGQAVGKRLDFLMQELNREANTLGSKSVASDVSGAAMELKLCIEQMREQVQNLE